MKFSTATLITIVSADDKKVPPGQPLDRLNRLTELSNDILNNWYSWSPSKNAWIQKFTNNAKRMERNFKRGSQRCRSNDENSISHDGPSTNSGISSFDEFERHNQEDPVQGIKQITTGFREWTELYLAACSGQKKFQYQINRMNRWNIKLRKEIQILEMINPILSFE